MIKKSSTFISGSLAFGIYFMLIGLLIFYFNTREDKKPENYVKKNEQRIQVALSTTKKAIDPKPQIKPKSKPKPKVKPKVKVKPKPKPKKEVKKKVIKEKVVKKRVKKKDENLTKPKKKAIDLFANVKISKKKNLIQVSDEPIKTAPQNSLIKVTDKPMSASERISSSLTVQNSDKGVESAYFAKVQNMLEGWPAQSDYAGEKATVVLDIDPSGKFEFRVVSASNIEAFNTGLIAFLEQLQGIGFGSHNAGRTYKFEAEFIAKE